MTDHQQQGAFPLAGSSSSNNGPDTDMSPAWAPAAAAAGAGGRSGRQGAMADLEQALGLAAAWFDGDAGAAQWAAAADDGAAEPPSPTGVPRWQEGSGVDADQFLQDLQLPGLDQQQQQQGQEGQQPGGLWLDDLGSPTNSAGFGGSSSSLLLPEEPPLGSLADATASDAATGSADAAAGAAAGVAQGLQHMHLDDIDAELADSVVPGQLLPAPAAGGCCRAHVRRAACLHGAMACCLSCTSCAASCAALQARAPCRSRQPWRRINPQLPPRQSQQRRPSCLLPPTWWLQRTIR